MTPMRFTRILSVGLLLLFSGCVIGGDSQSYARELSEMRKNVVPNGLLVPPTAAAQHTYQDALLAFRKKLSPTDSTLNAYISGSISLLNMQMESNEATSLLQGIDPTLLECGPNTTAGNAITHYEAARTDAQEANAHFQTVQANAELANTLGADYVITVRKTTQAIIAAHADRINELKAACGEI